MNTVVEIPGGTVAAPASVVRRAGGSARPALRWTVEHALPRLVMRRLAGRGDLQGQVFVESDGDKLFPLFEQIRSRGPVYRGRFAYLTTSHALAKDVLAGNEYRVGIDRNRLPGPLSHLARWGGEGAPLGPLTPPSLLAVEPPDHTRYRKLVVRVFSARAVRELRDRAVEVADELLDQLAGLDEVDLVERYCSQLPVIMIAEILGVPPEERAQVLAFGEGAAPSLDLGLSWSGFREVERSLIAFEEWLDEHIARLRANPADDLLSQLVRVQDEGRGLDDNELKATAGLVLAAGFETTVNLLGNGISLLTAHRDQLQGLLATDDDEAVAAWTNAVDEILRVDPPVLMTGRTAKEDTQLGDTVIPAGSLVSTVLAAANRDPDVFADPQRFDVTRPNASDHLSFSSGRHFCLGAQLARMEGEVGLSRLFHRYPDLTLLPGARRRPTRILRGYATLPARLDT